MSLLLNSEKALTFQATTYTGNGASQDIIVESGGHTLGSVDFTVASNGSGYWLDRTTFEVKNDSGTVVPSGSCGVNLSKVHLKDRDDTGWHRDYDGLRGLSVIYSNEPDAEAPPNPVAEIISYNSDGFTIGENGNIDAHKFITYSTLYTAVTWGLTNQGKKYVEAYNRSTGDTMIMYDGSGTAGHQIPCSVGRLGYSEVKCLNVVANWNTNINATLNYMKLNTDEAAVTNTTIQSHYDNYVSLGTSGDVNYDTRSYILYGKAKSTTWTIVEYVGTGVAGNFVETLDSNNVGQMPRRVILKPTSEIGNWNMRDSARGTDSRLFLNLLDAQAIDSYVDFNASGFTLQTTGSGLNDTGVSHIALVEFDTNADGGGSFADTQPSKIMMGGVKADKVMLGTVQVF